MEQVSINFLTNAPGSFNLTHGLGVLPTSVIFEFTDGGTVWFQDARYDTSSLFLVASDAGITGTVVVFAGGSGP
jgi:hypothetical protein